MEAMMHVTVDLSDNITAWRGYRATGDIMSGRGALIIHTATNGIIELVGTPDQLAALRDAIHEAMTADGW